MTVTDLRPTEHDPLPARPLPHELAEVPAIELAESAIVYAALIGATTYADGTPVPADEVATRALWGLAAGTVALDALARHMLALADAARLAGATAGEVRQRVSEVARVAMAFTPVPR